MQKLHTLLFILVITGIVTLIPAKSKAQTLTDSLRLYISFDDSTSNDQTSKHQVSALGTPNIVQGKFGKGLEFNGKDQDLSVLNIEDITLNNQPNRDFSISLWFYNTDTTTTKISPILGRLIDASTNTDYNIFLENGKLIWGTGNSIDSCAWSRIAEPSRNAWHHLVVTYSSANGTSGTKQIYLDNTLVKTCNFTQKAAPNARLTIGSFMSGKTGNREFFQGNLDEIRFYNRLLSSTEVSKLYTPTTSIQENVVNQNLQVYPNPVKDHLRIQLPENKSSFTIEIINTLGQSVLAKSNISSANNLSINVDHLEKGIYLVKVSDRKSVYLSKIIKE